MSDATPFYVHEAVLGIWYVLHDEVFAVKQAQQFLAGQRRAAGQPFGCVQFGTLTGLGL